MTVKELRQKLFEIKDQDQEVSIYVNGRIHGDLKLTDEIETNGATVYLQTEAN